jgi:hypothetical protein
MRSSLIYVFSAGAALGLACFNADAAEFPFCRQISSPLVKAHSSWNGASCAAVKYTVNNKTFTSTTCTCSATFCGEICIPSGNGTITCRGGFSNATCTPVEAVAAAGTP